MSDLSSPNLKSTTKAKPPGPVAAFLQSLLLYPGRAHFKLGYRRLGFLFAAIFTLALALYIRFWVYPQALYFIGLLDATSEPVMPPDSGAHRFWLAILLIPYLGIALHAALLAMRYRDHFNAQDASDPE